MRSIEELDVQISEARFSRRTFRFIGGIAFLGAGVNAAIRLINGDFSYIDGAVTVALLAGGSTAIPAAREASYQLRTAREELSAVQTEMVQYGFDPESKEDQQHWDELTQSLDYIAPPDYTEDAFEFGSPTGNEGEW